MNDSTAGAQRAYLIEQIFASWDEYEAYYDEACKIHTLGRKSKNNRKKTIRKYFEVEFKTSLKSRRYYYPADSEAIILQIPARGIKPQARSNQRNKLLDEHQHILGTTEMYIKDQIAMRLKIMGVKIKNKRVNG